MKKKVKLELKPYMPKELVAGVYRFIKEENLIDCLDDNDVELILTSIESGFYPDNTFVKPYLVSDGEVIATPEQIGLTYDIQYEYIDGGELKDIETWELQEIVKNNYECEVEMVDEFSHPELFQHVGWGDGLPIPRMVNNKIVILK